MPNNDCVMEVSFSVIDIEGPHGPTTYHKPEEVKIRAYSYMARLQAYTTTETTFHEDGCITVKSPGLMDATFAPNVSAVEA